MFTDNDLRELLEFQSPTLVLSIYLNTEPSEGNADAYKLRLRNLLKEVNLPQDVGAVERFVDLEYKVSGRGLAIFSCAAQNFFRAYALAVPVRDLIHLGNRASVKPLADLMDVYGGYGVVLVDKQGARLFYFHLGELREQEGVLGEAVKHSKRGSASSITGQRGSEGGAADYMEVVVERNMKESADFAIHFFEENHVRRVLIGGTDENVAMFRNLLPKAWQSLVMGTFPMPINSSQTEVLQRALQVGRDAETHREVGLIEHVITGAAKGAGAVTGVEATLIAVNQGRVKTLLVPQGAHKGGHQCSACQAITSEGGPNCPACGEAKLMLALDVFDLAVSSVLRQGGEIEVVHVGSELEKAGGMGAVLRY